MSLLKFIDRLRRIDDLVKRESTGPADEFAAKVGISRSMLMENLREMREMGAEIEYCQRKKNYQYISEFDLIIGHSAKVKTRGGSHLVVTNNISRFLTATNPQAF